MLHEILVLPDQIRIQCDAGDTLIERLAQAGVSLLAPCGGNGTCGKCVVWLAEGEQYFSQAEAAFSSPPSWNDLRSQWPFKQHRACQATINGPMVVWVPNESRPQTSHQIVTSHFTSDQSALREQTSLLQVTAVKMTPPSRDDARSDVERLTDAIAATSGQTCEDIPLELLRMLPHQLRGANWEGTAIHANDRLIAFQSNDETTEAPIRYAVAVDIGTTTLAAELIDVAHHRSCGVASRHNKQATHGDDIISRIQYAAESDAQLQTLHTIIVDEINAMINELVSKTNIAPHQIAMISIAGNTVMQQLVHGIDPQYLGHSPFAPATLEYPVTTAAASKFVINTNGLVVTLPVIGGFVGGDLVAGLIATDIRSQHRAALLIDIGTNGEMILWCHNDNTDGHCFATATAAGPAFEGARIQHGMIAAPGAIEKFEITDETVHIKTIGHQPPIGICGSGLIDLTAELLRIGAINSMGQLLSGDQLPNTVPSSLRDRFFAEGRQTRFVIVSKHESGIDADIVLTQRDIRQVQLAAGAIRTGITLLLRQTEIDQTELETVYLAGGFGNYIRRENAQRIGLLPHGIPTVRIQFCGNTSLAGAKAVLQDVKCYNEMRLLPTMCEHVDLAFFPDFQTVFADAMQFPKYD